MAYTVAYDGASKATDRAYLGKGERGIPLAFVVDRTGAIAWSGHPAVLRQPLDDTVAGTLDAGAISKRAQEAEDAYLGAMRLFPTDAPAGLLAWDQAERNYPILAADLIGPKFEALMAAGQGRAAAAVGRRLLEEATRHKDADGLNRLAWSIVNPQATLDNRDLDLALEAATAASDLTKHQDAGILDTLARVQFCRGDVEAAIELQTQAVGLADDEMRERLSPALDEYRRAKR